MGQKMAKNKGWAMPRLSVGSHDPKFGRQQGEERLRDIPQPSDLKAARRLASSRVNQKDSERRITQKERQVPAGCSADKIPFRYDERYRVVTAFKRRANATMTRRA